MERLKKLEKKIRGTNVADSIKLIGALFELADYEIGREMLDHFNIKLNQFYGDTLTNPIKLQNVKRVGRQLGTFFTKNIKNPEIN